MPASHYSVFLHARRPSCHWANSVKALKAEKRKTDLQIVFYHVHVYFGPLITKNRTTASTNTLLFCGSHFVYHWNHATFKGYDDHVFLTRWLPLWESALKWLVPQCTEICYVSTWRMVGSPLNKHVEYIRIEQLLRHETDPLLKVWSIRS